MALARSAEPNFVVFVKPTYRRQGIGTRLVELCNSGVLTLRTKNPEAVAFARSVSKLDDLRVEVLPRRYCEYDLRGEQEDQGSAK